MESKHELDRYLGLLPREDEKQKIRAALAEVGEVTVERA
jgi:hypothetical protein